MSAQDLTLPADIYAEKMILGAILLENQALGEAQVKLTPADFSLDSHQRIYQRMTELGGAGHAIDLVTLANELAKYKEIESVGGVAYLSSLTQDLPRRPVIEEYVRIVKDKGLLRSLVLLAQSISARAYDQSETGLEVAAWTATATSQLVESSTTTSTVFSVADLIPLAEDRLLRPSMDSDAIPYGLPGLDMFTNGGIRQGELGIIAAAPGRGKTAFARQIVKHAVLGGIPCYVHSGEMTKESWLDITACLIEEMPAWKVRDPFLLNLADKERLRGGLRTLSGLPFYISDAGGIDIGRLIFNATQAKLKHDIQLFVVDYAQLIKAPGKERKDQVGAVASRLREFAKEYGVATILLSQMARAEGRNLNARPNMFGLKESGTLEESAHIVILNYMPVNVESGAFTGEDELIVAKQRFGPVGSVKVRFNGENLRFEDR